MPRTDRLHFDSNAPATVFDQVNQIIARSGPADLIRLDMGDTTLKPPAEGRPSGLKEDRWPAYNLYTQTTGIPELRELLLKKLRERNGMELAGVDQIQLTCGAIHALFAAFKTVTRPGEEVLVLAPRWPLITGVIQQTGARPVDLPFYTRLADEGDAELEQWLGSRISDRTSAIYLNTPNNPSSQVLDESQLRRIGAVAARHGLWVVSDEAYEDFIYSDQPHVSPATLPEFAGRTISIFTFSKCLAAAGYRVGYAAADVPLIAEMNRVSAQTIYNPPSNNQQSAAQALQSWDSWFPAIKDSYRTARDLFARECEARFTVPGGGFYAFINMENAVSRRRKDGQPAGEAALLVLEDLIRDGVALLPGEAFGEGYECWLRACFIAEPEGRLRRGIASINRILGDAR